VLYYRESMASVDVFEGASAPAATAAMERLVRAAAAVRIGGTGPVRPGPARPLPAAPAPAPTPSPSPAGPAPTIAFAPAAAAAPGPAAVTPVPSLDPL
jgi:hypothetical protein